MSKKVVLVGHCGADTAYLRMAVSSADHEIKVLAADDTDELEQLIREGIDLVLLNRELGWGFESTPMGVDLIKFLRPKYPELRMMLISNHADAQAAAAAEGALPGFGKREIGSPRVAKLLREALALVEKTA